jgi:hypothetical protein
VVLKERPNGPQSKASWRQLGDSQGVRRHPYDAAEISEPSDAPVRVVAGRGCGRAIAVASHAVTTTLVTWRPIHGT